MLGIFIRLFLAPFTTNFDFETFKMLGIVTFTENLNPFKFFAFYGYMWWYTLLAVYPFYLLASLFWQSVLLENLFLKLPMIMGDIAISLFLFYVVKSSTKNIQSAKMAFLFWLLNPYTIWSSSVHGTLDVFPGFLTLLSLFLLIKKRRVLSGFVLSMATFYKPYVIVLVPFYGIPLIKEQKSLKEGFRQVFCFTAGFALTSFIINVPTLEPKIFINWQSSAQIYTSRFSVTPLTYLWLFQFTGLLDMLPSMFLNNYFFFFTLPLYMALVFYLYMKGKMQHINLATVSQNISLCILLLFLTYPRIDPQNLNWLLPFIIILACLGRISFRLAHSFWITIIVWFLVWPPIESWFVPYAYVYSSGIVTVPDLNIAHIPRPPAPWYWIVIGLAFSMLCLYSFIVLMRSQETAPERTHKATQISTTKRGNLTLSHWNGFKPSRSQIIISVFFIFLLISYIYIASFNLPRQSWWQQKYYFNLYGSQFESKWGDSTVNSSSLQINTANLTVNYYEPFGWKDDSFTNNWMVNPVETNLIDHAESSDGEIYQTTVTSSLDGYAVVGYAKRINISSDKYPYLILRLRGTENARFGVMIRVKDNATAKWYSIFHKVSTPLGFTVYAANITQVLQQKGIVRKIMIDEIALQTYTSKENQTVINYWDFIGFAQSTPDAGAIWKFNLLYLFDFFNEKIENATEISIIVSGSISYTLPSYILARINNSTNIHLDVPSKLIGTSSFSFNIPYSLFKSQTVFLKLILGPNLEALITSITIQVWVHAEQIFPWWKENVAIIVESALIESIVAITAAYVVLRRKQR